jgi:hypothetical protein
VRGDHRDDGDEAVIYLQQDFDLDRQLLQRVIASPLR